MRRVRGVYTKGMIQLQESVDEADGTEVDVIFSSQDMKDARTRLLRAAEGTRGVWAGDENVAQAFRELEIMWAEWKLPGG